MPCADDNASNKGLESVGLDLVQGAVYISSQLDFIMFVYVKTSISPFFGLDLRNQQ